jgi:hypothetical protein
MTDRDLERWTAAWREGTPPAVDLARMAARERRWLAAWIALDWAFGLGFIAVAGWLWFVVGTASLRFVAVGIVALTVTALAYISWNWRGAFADDRSPTADYLALAGRRSRARLRYVRFGWWILAADIAIIGGYHGLEFIREGSLPSGQALATAALVLVATAIFILWWERRERRRGARIEDLRRALGAENGNG